MDIKAIKTEDDYIQALKRLEVKFHAPIDSEEGKEAEVLSILIEKYEEKNYPFDVSDLI
jgi:HTH-type transcriptional regulator/antitoxin HigA